MYCLPYLLVLVDAQQRLLPRRAHSVQACFRRALRVEAAKHSCVNGRESYEASYEVRRALRLWRRLAKGLHAATVAL